MKIVETTFERLPRERLEIGFEGENLRATVRIDCASVFAEYPNATPSLIVKPLFADAYPVVVERSGTCVAWLITSEILSFTGDGEIQLVFYKDQVICKSAVSKIRVSRSLMVNGETPDPVAQWIDAANAKLAEVDAVIVSIDEMDATAYGLPEGSAPTAEVQDVDDHKRIVLGIPAGATGAKGEKGDRGERGEQGLQGIQGERGLQGSQGVKGDRGEKGETGATGATGATPDLSIGTVSTLPAGSSATAEITGTAENPVLSLGIPQGAQGIQGEQGEKGDPGDGTPVGGLTDQVLAKASDTDYDTEWIHVASVIKNTASGAIASFPDGADGHPIDELKVGIEPVRDLHGYDHPWPGGGNVNLFDGEIEQGDIHPSTGQNINSTSRVRSVNYTPIIPSQDYYYQKDSNDYGFYVYSYNSNKEFVRFVDGNGLGGVFSANENEYYLRFRWNTADQTAVTGLHPMVSKGSARQTDWTPFSNICPITGWDGVKVSRTGINVWDEDWESGFFSYSGVKSNSDTAIRSKNFCVCAPGTIYYAFCGNATSDLYVLWYDATQNFIVRQNAKNTRVKSPENAHYFKVSTSPNYQETYGHDISLNYPATDTEYHPGTVQTVDITFHTEAGTVYGGELTVNADGSGSLVVDRAIVTISSASGGVTVSNNTVRFRVGNVLYNGWYLLASSEIISNMLIRRDYTTDRPSFSHGDSSSAVFFKLPLSLGLTTIAQINEWLTNNPIQLCYPLENPITYTLTPTEIRTILGTNNVWSDAGDVSVKYNADTKLYIDNKITQAIAAALNS